MQIFSVLLMTAIVFFLIFVFSLTKNGKGKLNIYQFSCYPFKAILCTFILIPMALYCIWRQTNGRFYVQPISVFFWPKMCFIPTFLKRLIFISEKATFSGRGQNMVRVQKWIPFFGPKISVFGQKIWFLPYDPNFRWWPIFSPRHDG